MLSSDQRKKQLTKERRRVAFLLNTHILCCYGNMRSKNDTPNNLASRRTTMIRCHSKCASASDCRLLCWPLLSDNFPLRPKQLGVMETRDNSSSSLVGLCMRDPINFPEKHKQSYETLGCCFFVSYGKPIQHIITAMHAIWEFIYEYIHKNPELTKIWLKYLS